MNREKILKIIKGLNRFCLDDIAIMAGLDEIKTNLLLEKFLQEGLIAKLSGLEYRYINKMPERREIFRLVEKPVIKLIPDNDITFKQAAEYFLTNHALKNCTPSTFKAYKSSIKFHLVPYFGKMLLKKITQQDIKNFIELKIKEKVSDKNIRNCVTLLGTMFNKFKEWGFASDSPYNGIVNAKPEMKPVIRILKVPELNELLQILKPNNLKAYRFTLLISSAGIKKAETFALKPDDINFKTKKININKTLWQGELLLPKAQHIIRQADIPESIIPELKEAVKNKQEDDFIFYDKSTSFFTQNKKMIAAFTSATKQLNLDNFTFDDLRHTYAYNTLQQGKSIDYLHKQLGDYSIQATMDKYRDFIS